MGIVQVGVIQGGVVLSSDSSSVGLGVEWDWTPSLYQHQQILLFLFSQRVSPTSAISDLGSFSF